MLLGTSVRSICTYCDCIIHLNILNRENGFRKLCIPIRLIYDYKIHDYKMSCLGIPTDKDIDQISKAFLSGSKIVYSSR
jgi:hypothetical protein